MKRLERCSEIIKKRGATEHSEKTGHAFCKVACSLRFLDDFGGLLARFERCRNRDIKVCPGWRGGGGAGKEGPWWPDATIICYDRIYYDMR